MGRYLDMKSRFYKTDLSIGNGGIQIQRKCKMDTNISVWLHWKILASKWNNFWDKTKEFLLSINNLGNKWGTKLGGRTLCLWENANDFFAPIYFAAFQPWITIFGDSTRTGAIKWNFQNVSFCPVSWEYQW